MILFFHSASMWYQNLVLPTYCRWKCVPAPAMAMASQPSVSRISFVWGVSHHPTVDCYSSSLCLWVSSPSRILSSKCFVMLSPVFCSNFLVPKCIHMNSHTGYYLSFIFLVFMDLAYIHVSLLLKRWSCCCFFNLIMLLHTLLHNCIKALTFIICIF